MVPVSVHKLEVENLNKAVCRKKGYQYLSPHNGRERTNENNVTTPTPIPRRTSVLSEGMLKKR
jgi:hypothetical protein